MATSGERALSTARKRRGIAKASITRLEIHITELERKDVLTAEDRLATQRLLQRLDALDADFKSHHFAVVDLLDEDDTDAVDAQQAILENDNHVAALTVRIQRLAAGTSTSSPHSTELDPAQRLGR